MFFVFFFKQKTAYEMHISDWSSDVCSSDLLGATGWRAPDPHLQEQLRRVYLPDIRVDRRPPRNSSSKGSPSNSRAIVPWKSTHPLRPSLPHKPGAGNALESGPRDGNWDDQ